MPLYSQKYVTFKNYDHTEVIPRYVERRRFERFTFPISSKVIVDGIPMTSEWKILIDDITTEFVQGSVELVALINSPTNTVEAVCRFSLVDGKERSVHEVVNTGVYDLAGNNRSTRVNLAPVDVVVDPGNGLLIDGKLTVRCQLKIKEREMEAGKGGTDTSCLSHRVMSIFGSGEYSDVVLRVSDKTYRAHKVVLAARSPVFKAMFTSNMMEKTGKEVVIEEMEPVVMSQLLDYIYSEKLPDSISVGLFEAADRYGLLLLADLCETRLQLTAENAFEMLVIADRHLAGRLKERAFQFITLNIPDGVVNRQMEELQQTYPHLATDFDGWNSDLMRLFEAEIT